MKWTQIAFHIAWNQESEKPKQWMDCAIADAIIGNVMHTFKRDKMIWWRFHRRAARDEHGHIFRFGLYAKKSVGKRWYDEVLEHSVTRALKSNGLIDATTKTRKDGVADENWPEMTQAAWYPFIQGASECWLSLVRALWLTHGKEFGLDWGVDADDIDVENLEEGYQAVNDKIAEMWNEDMTHPLLHHLNAVFGYGWMNARVTIPMRF